ncbi:MAG TPA: hypothetical protein VFN95_12475 [Flavitalea sp.]|nr:hypothetical protein [Flavitalea sp.]
MNGMKYDRETSYRIDEMEPDPGGSAMIRTAYFRYSEPSNQRFVSNRTTPRQESKSLRSYNLLYDLKTNKTSQRTNPLIIK